jgi:hypothetical protein
MIQALCTGDFDRRKGGYTKCTGNASNVLA